MYISIVVPVYNEAKNIGMLVDSVDTAMAGMPDWELIVVNDGSTDNTLGMIENCAQQKPYIKVMSFDKNQGQGNAIKAGFRSSSGEIVVVLDGDLSYNPADIAKLIEPLQDNPMLDIVLGSPYSRNGSTEGIPFPRLFLSKGANRLLGFALPGRLKTVTGMFRAYRRSLIECLDLESDGKEIHFEILSKALATGTKVKEVPVVLRGRVHGESKIRIRASVISHLLFSFFERPAILFEIIGLVLVFMGLISGIYIIWLWQHAALDPTRPLMILMALLIIVGSIVLSFGFIASQVAEVRKEVYRVQRENLDIKRRLDNGGNREKD